MIKICQVVCVRTSSKWLAQTSHLSALAHRHAISHGEPGMEPLQQVQRTTSIRLVETAIQLLTHAGGEGPRAPHESYLLAKILWEVLQ